MAEQAGHGGSITINSYTAGVHLWHITRAVIELDTTDFGDGGNYTCIGGIKSWRGDFTAHWDAANTLDPGDSANITLTAATGDTYAGTVLILTEDTITDVNGLVVQSVTFVGSHAGGCTVTL